MEFVVVLVTVESSEQGERIAETLVGECLAGCVNIVGPIRSVYTWEAAIRRDEEHLLVIKTRRDLFDQLAARVRELHAYSVPEVVALPITVGSAPYLDWLREATERKN